MRLSSLSNHYGDSWTQWLKDRPSGGGDGVTERVELDLSRMGSAESRPCAVEADDQATDEGFARRNCPYWSASGLSKSLSEADSVAWDAVDDASE
jgi:hypothetical protein